MLDLEFSEAEVHMLIRSRVLNDKRATSVLWFLIALVLFATQFAPSAWAIQIEVMDFEVGPSLGCCGDAYNAGEEYVQHGFAITPADPPNVGQIRRDTHTNNPGRAWNGSVLLTTYNDVEPYLYRPDGYAFALFSIDLSEYGTFFDSPYDVTLIGEKVGGALVSTTLVLDGIIDGRGGAADFQSFVLGSEWTDLVRVDFVALNDSLVYAFAMDNIELAAVPEPGTALLVGLGLVALGRRSACSHPVA